MQFRIPTAIVGGNLDPIQAKNSAISNGLDISLDLVSNPVYKTIYDEGIQYDSGSPNSPLIWLNKMTEGMGGKTHIKVKGKILNAFGILANNPNYEIGGITTPLAGISGFLGKLLNDVNSESLTFTIDLMELIPNTSIFAGVPSVQTVTLEFATIPPIIIPIPIPIGAILSQILSALGLDVTWRGLAQNIIGDLGVSIDLNELKQKLQDQIYGLLPEQFTLFKGILSWGVSMEKQGIIEVKVDVDYQPHFPGPGPTIKKTLIMQREFRVADIQPIAPDYTFFVANSAKLFEDPDAEISENWEGNDRIDLNDGDGALIIHNLPALPDLWESLQGILSLDLKEISRKAMLPGLVRINGTRSMTINISMIDPDSLSNVKLMEMASLLLNHKDGSSHSLVPKVEEVWWNPWGGDGWDWPYYGDSGLWIPTLLPRYARTLLFGNYHLEFPMSLKAEGNLYKRFSHIKFLIVKIYIPPFPPWFYGFAFAFPWPWQGTEEEPYGYCKYPPWEEGENPETLWDPNYSKNFPANLYSPQQYVKKASYYYPTSIDFQNDIDSRLKEVGGEQVFICDGVTFVNDNLWIDRPLKVMGRGMIVAAGNIHLSSNILAREYDSDGNPTIFSLIARNGAIINKFNDIEVHACLYGDRGIINSLGSELKIYGNLVVNKFNRSDCQGKVHVYYKSKHARSSLLSMIRSIAKYDPTRYYVTVSNKVKTFEFLKK
ncbi:hypothetical protein HYY75_02400 [bacterium]|nr:hypothetical protein [bacterium]